MKDRQPTPFEAKVLRSIQRLRGHFQGGDRRVAHSAAARRLERLGYAMKPGEHWYTTEKGDAYLAAADAAHILAQSDKNLRDLVEVFRMPPELVSP